MTYITSEDLADLDDTIEDEMQVEEFAMAAAREASAMLLDLLIAHHGRRSRLDGRSLPNRITLGAERALNPAPRSSASR